MALSGFYINFKILDIKNLINMPLNLPSTIKLPVVVTDFLNFWNIQAGINRQKVLKI